MRRLVFSLILSLAASTASAKPGHLQYASSFGYLADPHNSQHHAQVY